MRSKHTTTRLAFEDAILIWFRLLKGEYQHRIAAAFDVNQGRISEIKTGKLFPGSMAAALLMHAE